MNVGNPITAWPETYLKSQPTFDPLQVNNQGRVRALAVFIAAIVLTITLAESVSQEGIRFDV